MTYEEYIASSTWAKRAARIHKRDRNQCQTCLSTENLEVHHKTYERLFNEPDGDLITLCVICHEAITNSIRARRYDLREYHPQDVVRLLPERIEINHGLPIPDIQDFRCCAPDPPQRPTGRSAERVDETPQDYQRQTPEDRRRSYRAGTD